MIKRLINLLLLVCLPFLTHAQLVLMLDKQPINMELVLYPNNNALTNALDDPYYKVLIDEIKKGKNDLFNRCEKISLKEALLLQSSQDTFLLLKLTYTVKWKNGTENATNSFPFLYKYGQYRPLTNSENMSNIVSQSYSFFAHFSGKTILRLINTEVDENPEFEKFKELCKENNVINLQKANYAVDSAGTDYYEIFGEN